mmetsp:Transcript_16405/g.62312  ORF Transcript_16405/g.62312 Transcript_16405/m.62312 type:complete len:208 (+) Transcript_16405:404-1027(+)
MELSPPYCHRRRWSPKRERLSTRRRVDSKNPEVQTLATICSEEECLGHVRGAVSKLEDADLLALEQQAGELFDSLGASRISCRGKPANPTAEVDQGGELVLAMVGHHRLGRSRDAECRPCYLCIGTEVSSMGTLGSREARPLETRARRHPRGEEGPVAVAAEDRSALGFSARESLRSIANQNVGANRQRTRSGSSLARVEVSLEKDR